MPTAVSVPSESDRSSSTIRFSVSASNQAKLPHKHSWCQINRQKSSVWLLFKYRCGMASVEDAERSGRPSTIKAYRSVTHPVSWTQDVVSTTRGVVSLGHCIYKINVTLSQLLVKTSRIHSPSASNGNETSIKEKWLKAAGKPLNRILE
jgi:hypothetical protein